MKTINSFVVIRMPLFLLLTSHKIAAEYIERQASSYIYYVYIDYVLQEKLYIIRDV